MKNRVRHGNVWKGAGHRPIEQLSRQNREDMALEIRAIGRGRMT
jgi:hypothetical protein